jgi:hypothetical protein
MTRDDIIKMAESCGIPEYENNESQAENIIRFFHMAQAAEREACAKVCEVLTPTDINGVCPVADAIRKRGQA